MKWKKAVIAVVIGGALIGAIVLLCVYLRSAPPPPPVAPPSRPTPDQAVEPAPSPPEAGPPAEPRADTSSAMLRVYGAVMDADQGTPVPRALVTASKADAGESRPGHDEDVAHSSEDAEAPSAQTDETGAFSLELQGEGWKVAMCLAPGYARAQHTLPESKDTSVRIDFMLQPGARVLGVVTDATTTKGVEGVTVEAASTQQSMVGLMTSRRHGAVDIAQSGADGSYAIEGLGLGSYRITVQARSKGYVFRQENAVTLDIKTCSDYEGVNFSIEPGAVVQGTVMNMKNAPVADAKVRAVPGQMFQAAMDSLGSMDMDALTSLRAKTDAAGCFQIAGLDFDRDYRVSADAQGYAEASSDLFRVKRGETKDVAIILFPGSRVSGSAHYPDGQPASRRQLHLRPDFAQVMAGRFTKGKSVSANEDGSFVFEEVAAGRYTIQAGFGIPFAAFGGQPEGVIVEADGINEVKNVEVVVDRKPASKQAIGEGVIEGVVLDASGRPVAKARVEAKRSDKPTVTGGATTQANGAFKLTKLEDAPYDLSVLCDQGVGDAAGVSPGSKVTIRLSEPTLVSGVVVDGGSNPAASCAVTLQKRADKPNLTPLSAVMKNLFGEGVGSKTTDAAGYFEFRNVTPGAYVVQATSRSQGTGKSRSFSVVAGVNVTDLRITLDPGVSFSGTVKDMSGRPVSGAQIRLTDAPENPAENLAAMLMPPTLTKTAGSDTSDALGLFQIDRVPPGTYTVTATHSQYARFQARDVTVAAGRDLSGYSIVLGKGGGATGRYLVNGEPRPGMMVQVIGPSEMRILTTDSEGRFELDGLPEGSYIVNVIDPTQIAGASQTGMSSSPQVVDVTEGQTSDLNLDTGQGVPVFGTVSGDDLGLLVSVTLRKPGGPSPEQVNVLDLTQLIDSMRYLAGQGIVGQNGDFRLDGVKPGTYILEVHSLDLDPKNPNLEALMAMDRTPRLRQEVVVDAEPLSFNLTVPSRPR